MTPPEDTTSLEPPLPNRPPDTRALLEVVTTPTTWRLLVVDDDERNYRLIRKLLRQGLPGATIDRVGTLADACRAAAASDCVLLDIGLPDADGIAGVKRLTQKAPNTAIVVLARAASEELGAASLSAGSQDYLIKGRMD